MGAGGEANIIFKKEIESAQDPQATRTQKIEEYREAFATPYQAAKRGFVDRVILPEETRGEIYRALVQSESKRQLRPRRKHGVMPS
jgi:acetyl-CoA carboxylase carboxyltransferase component